MVYSLSAFLAVCQWSSSPNLIVHLVNLDTQAQQHQGSETTLTPPEEKSSSALPYVAAAGQDRRGSDEWGELTDVLYSPWDSIHIMFQWYLNVTVDGKQFGTHSPFPPFLCPPQYQLYRRAMGSHTTN